MKKISYTEENNIILSEPKSKPWGGRWTELKLDAFEKYVNAYLTIMNKYRDKFSWKLIYFDGFAGSGSRAEVKGEVNELMNSLFEKDIDQSELNVYKGAAERILNITQRGFDYYYFIDSHEESSKKLQSKLQPYKKDTYKLEFRNTDANSEVDKLAKALKKNKSLYALVLLDPFGMQIDWSTIEKLAKTNTDLWILIPTGVIINRLLDTKANLTHIDKLSSFFGMSEKEIKDYFYVSKIQNTLFGEQTIVKKVEEPIKKIAELYIEKLKSIFEHVTEQPLVMNNTRNVPIFHFAFASNNASAKKIAGQIINKS